jgi:hypothetical protein
MARKLELVPNSQNLRGIPKRPKHDFTLPTRKEAGISGKTLFAGLVESHSIGISFDAEEFLTYL